MRVAPPPSELAEIAATWDIVDYPLAMNVTLGEDGETLEADQPDLIPHAWQTPWGQWKDEATNPVHAWLFREPGSRQRQEQVLAHLKSSRA